MHTWGPRLSTLTRLGDHSQNVMDRVGGKSRVVQDTRPFSFSVHKTDETAALLRRIQMWTPCSEHRRFPRFSDLWGNQVCKGLTRSSPSSQPLLFHWCQNRWSRLHVTLQKLNVKRSEQPHTCVHAGVRLISDARADTWELATHRVQLPQSSTA